MLNPKEAVRDKIKRADIISEIESRLEELQQLDGEPHENKACALRTHPVYGRYIRQTKSGQLRLNKGEIQDEERLGGKFLVSTSDDSLSVEDVVFGYKQLFEIERVFRDLKHTIDIRPVRHRLPDRIPAHVLLCWLAMLLIRVAENETGQTWHQIKKCLDTLDVGIHLTPSGEVWQTNPASTEVKELFEQLGLKQPPRILSMPSPRKDDASLQPFLLLIMPLTTAGRSIPPFFVSTRCLMGGGLRLLKPQTFPASSRPCACSHAGPCFQAEIGSACPE